MVWYVWAGWLLYGGSAVLGMWRGGPPERWAGVMIGAAGLATIASRGEWTHRYSGVEWGVMIVDVLLAIGLASIALNARRLWPIACTTCATISAVAHVARIFDPLASRTAYELLVIFSAYTMPLTLIVGTVRHRRRLARIGVDQSWRRSSPAAARPQM